MQGYGLYWYCIELIAGKIDSTHLTFELEHDAEIIGYDTGVKPSKVTQIMEDMISLGLFENVEGIVTCLKIAKRLDETTSKLPQVREIKNGIRKALDKSGDSPVDVRRVSGECQDKVRPDKIRGDKIREEENIPSDEDQKWIPMELWAEWLRCRSRLKNPATNSPTALRLLVKYLREIHENGRDVEEAINLAIASGWKTVRLGWLENIDEKDKGNRGNAWSEGLRTLAAIADDAEEVDGEVVG